MKEDWTDTKVLATIFLILFGIALFVLEFVFLIKNPEVCINVETSTVGYDEEKEVWIKKISLENICPFSMLVEVDLRGNNSKDNSVPPPLDYAPSDTLAIVGPREFSVKYANKSQGSSEKFDINPPQVEIVYPKNYQESENNYNYPWAKFDSVTPDTNGAWISIDAEDTGTEEEV